MPQMIEWVKCYRKMEIASQHDSHYVPESSTLRGCRVGNYGNNDNPLLLTLRENHEKTYPKLPFGAQPGRNVRAKGQECWTCHSFWKINILNPCPIGGNHSLAFIEAKSVIHSFSLLPLQRGHGHCCLTQAPPTTGKLQSYNQKASQQSEVARDDIKQWFYQRALGCGLQD